MVSAGKLLPSEGEALSGSVYIDDLLVAQHDIHVLMEELYACHGSTLEEEAGLCLSLLMGYSVSMYANPEDDCRKSALLHRSRVAASCLSPSSPLRTRLLSLCGELE